MRRSSLPRRALLAACWLTALAHHAPTRAQETPPETRDQAVGASVNYVFATDLGSGVYDLDGRTLQIYRYNWRKELRAGTATAPAIRFTLPVTAGFFDFNPIDVIESGPPSRVDSLSVVPGFELDYLLADDWHLIPYVRGGFSIASSSVDGWLYGAGARLERRRDFDSGWSRFTRGEFAYAAVKYRRDVPDDRFIRLRQGVDFARGMGWRIRGREIELGLYGIFDVIFDPPTAPLSDGEREPVQLELGVTWHTRPAVKIWKFDAPRLGIGYRVAGDLSAWRIVIGAPF